MDVALATGQIFAQHEPPGPHPECPARIQAITSLLSSDSRLGGITQVDFEPADPTFIREIHAQAIVESLLRHRDQRGWYDNDTFFSPHSSEAALAAAGAAMTLAQKIYSGESPKRGFALVRPPGHHATPNQIMGFCLLNNISLAAHALQQIKPGIKLAIVDFDLHHGNGTQEIFYANPDVMFISSHRLPFYPGTGSVEEIGINAGKGTTINLPLSQPYGDKTLAAIYLDIAMPALRAFRPEMILVSAGFDGHKDDPMQGLNLTTSFFGALTRELINLAEEICGGRLLYCLEGGYNIAALRDSVEKVLLTMLNPHLAEPLENLRFGYDAKVIDELRQRHR